MNINLTTGMFHSSHLKLFTGAGDICIYAWHWANETVTTGFMWTRIVSAFRNRMLWLVEHVPQVVRNRVP
jgi:hypothetical protein